MKRNPLVILGIDAGDPDFIQRWTQEGYLPTIASILERGCWARTAGPELISEHGVWVSLFSGISRCQHGYYYFRQLRPGTYDLETVTGRNIEARPFWEYFQGRKKRLAIIDVPDVYPVEGLTGLQLANWASHVEPPISPSAEPPWLLRDVRRFYGRQTRINENSNGSVSEDRQIYRRLLEQINKKGELCRYLVQRDHFDLVVIVFSESHLAGHQFWKYRHGAQSSEKTAESSGLTYAIRDVYQGIDRQMGLLLAQLPEANVVVVSSVGMENDYPTAGLMEAFCRGLGYQIPLTPTNLSLNPLALARRMVPQAWRLRLSRGLPRETRERLLADQFRCSTNWQKTTAFAIPSFYTSFVRANLRGREPEGIVEPGRGYEALLDRLETDLKQLIDPHTGKPAVKKVGRTADIFSCGPPTSLPDLFVEWQPGRLLQRVLHPHAELVRENPEFCRASDHSSHGFIAAAGPDINRRGAMDDVMVLDLAPTFLALMGEPIRERLKGKVLGPMMAG